jgi:2-dehydropantoate 2-reductase
MKIAILGTGAMGCLFTARLAPQNDLIVLGTWREGIRAIQIRGVHLIENSREIVVPARATTDPREVADIELVLILVKGHQTERAARWAKQILTPNGIALTLQNGLGNLEILSEHVGPNRAAMGVSMQGTTLLGPGRVQHGGNGPTTLAVTPATRARLEQVAEIFRAAGFETHLTDDARTLIWGKLVVNTAINALTAILRVPNGGLVENQDALAVMRTAAEETAAVARALGVTLPFADPSARVMEVARATAQNRSSTLQDILRGMPTELDAINGAVVRAGKRLGIPTPVNETLLKIVKAGEARRGVEAEPIERLMALAA